MSGTVVARDLVVSAFATAGAVTDRQAELLSQAIEALAFAVALDVVKKVVIDDRKCPTCQARLVDKICPNCNG